MGLSARAVKSLFLRRLLKGQVRSVGLETTRMKITYPEANVIDLHALPEQAIGKTELFERLDGLGLDPICSSCGSGLGTVIEDPNIHAVSCQV